MFLAGRIKSQPGSIADYDPAGQQGGGAGGTPYSNRSSAGARQVYDSNVGRGKIPPSIFGFPGNIDSCRQV